MSDRDCENCKHHTGKGCDSWDCNFEQGMTRKEGLDWLYRLRSEIYVYMPKEWLIPMNNALDMAIKAIEYPEKNVIAIVPCGDSISRQAVLDAIEDDNRNGHYSCFASNNDAQCFKDVIRSLPSINPQEPKTGRWKKISPADIYECSECGQNVITADICAYRYCHGCGAKMEESEGKE